MMIAGEIIEGGLYNLIKLDIILLYGCIVSVCFFTRTQAGCADAFCDTRQRRGYIIGVYDSAYYCFLFLMVQTEVIREEIGFAYTPQVHQKHHKSTAETRGDHRAFMSVQAWDVGTHAACQGFP